MKTNKMLRIASVLLVAVMISTCAISGTFAKYVTSDTATDTARVAKFGVVVKATGGLFDETYKTTENVPGEGATDTDGVVLSVETSGAVGDISKLVAPGTKNTTGLNFAITGTPEVDVKIDVVVTGADKDVFLKAGTYEDLTTGNEDDKFILGDDYYPVKYTLKKDGNPVAGATGVDLATLKTKIESLSVAHVDANTDLSTILGNFTITWEWAYGTVGVISGVDRADTILGDLAAGSPAAGLDGATLTAGTDYNLTTGLTITVTVTQID